MNLQSRFFLIVGSVSLFFLLVIWVAFYNAAERLVERLGARFAEKQVLYDKTRTLQPLISDVALARQMAQSPTIKAWAQDEKNPVLYEAAQAVLEQFRLNLHSQSYTVAVARSGNYYFYEPRGKQARGSYPLNPSDPAHAWFYAALKKNQDVLLHVDEDKTLGVSKVWINVPLRDGDTILGTIGTGLDLDQFINRVADTSQPGISNFLINQDAAIQISRDINHINFASVANSAAEQSSVDRLLSRPADRNWIRSTIHELQNEPSGVETRFVRFAGKKYLAAVAALPELGWYDVTLLDLGVLLPQRDFLQILGLSLLSIASILTILAYSLHKLVLRPVGNLAASATRIEDSEFIPEPDEEGGGEIMALKTRFRTMAHAVQQNQNTLTNAVEQRTQQLLDAQKILTVALDREKKLRATQANLLYTMAHEVRRPLAVIGNTTQMLAILTQAKQQEWKPRLDKIMGAVNRLSLLITDLLDEDRLAMGLKAVQTRRGDLNAFCRDLAVTLSDRHGRVIRFEPAAAGADLMADWKLISIAVGNLVDNAAKYSPPGSGIVLRVLAADDTLSIEVIDTGPGIAPESQQRIFEKFVRLENQSGVSGSGLGLYLVMWVAEIHRGSAEVSSSENGSTFRIHLPRGSASPQSSS
ncbi:MAG: sensor histidine kinase [Polaromonas sp.]|uniref:sensor histidine kinase n=1 Tax=Polaromonas sp. TaxID=1869339 RepID=UPI0032639670